MPRLLILDEPTEGIQPSIIKDMSRVIRILADRGDMAILLVEQYYDVEQELADDYLVMERGEFIARGQGKETWKPTACGSWWRSSCSFFFFLPPLGRGLSEGGGSQRRSSRPAFNSKAVAPHPTLSPRGEGVKPCGAVTPIALLSPRGEEPGVRPGGRR